MPRSDRIAGVAAGEWAHGLIRSWEQGQWLDLPTRVGDRLAPVIGAPAGSVIVHDSTTVGLYQLVHAALAWRPDRTVIAVEPTEFPTDRYVVAGIARTTGATIRAGFADLDDVAVVGALARRLPDRRGRRSPRRGHPGRRGRCGRRLGPLPRRGAIEVDLAGAGVELAVGCTYKFLHGGPGAPAWAYVTPKRHAELDQPIWGWFAQRDQFEMGDRFEPQPDIRRLLLGTPGILGMAAAEVGIGLVADAGMAAIAAKGRALTGFALEMCRDHGLESVTPSDATRRGAHVAVRVADADAVHADLTRRGVITDVRRPDLIRLGCAALTTRFVDVFDGVTALAEVAGQPRNSAPAGNSPAPTNVQAVNKPASDAAVGQILPASPYPPRPPARAADGPDPPDPRRATTRAGHHHDARRTTTRPGRRSSGPS